MATNKSTIEMPRVKLGNQGLEVSRLGYGCMGLTGTYNNPLSVEEGIKVLKEAFNKGITFFDTADVYGADHANELLIGKLLKELPRDKIQLATKFGIFKIEPTKVTVKGTPEYARSCCEGSLKRLGVDYIDLYYIHRIDTTVPIEDTMEYSLWTREIEDELIPLCRELGIGIVPYSPVGRGFFGGKAIKEQLPANSFLQLNPRFTGENLTKNKNIYDRVEAIAEKHGCSTAQLALAWVLHQGNDVVPIPGTTKIKNLEENVNSVNVKLTKEEIEEISNAVPLDEVAGSKINEALLLVSWKFANTPPKNSNRSS
ncbi:perakine reductase isoform X2 [Helianthus annuus]|uniref:perakine reductase isoform X2 n=1 Tax=Helianthus annuus TaxID=4232 RepID=UPI0016531679|nr:perakine reductase isoform X2 [Helianthus annuus]